MKKKQKARKSPRKPSGSTGKRTLEAVTKDGPFPHSFSKDGPFPRWTRVHGALGKDAPFPMVEVGLEWERVPFETVFQGSRRTGPNRTETAVVHSSSDLSSKLPNITLPPVDFNTEELILVQLGKRLDNGYLVQIDEILYFTDRLEGRGPLTVVHYSEHRTPGRSDVLSYPLHVVKLRKLDGDTEFDPS